MHVTRFDAKPRLTPISKSMLETVLEQDRTGVHGRQLRAGFICVQTSVSREPPLLKRRRRDRVKDRSEQRRINKVGPGPKNCKKLCAGVVSTEPFQLLHNKNF